MIRVISESVQQTIDAGRKLSSHLQPGDILLLNGDLGAGKTQFVKGVAAGLGSSVHVSSPTFVIIHEYTGSIQLVHCDLYRLEEPVDPADIGLLDYLSEGESIVAIEWPERLGPGIQNYPVWSVNLESTAETTRTISIESPEGRTFHL